MCVFTAPWRRTCGLTVGKVYLDQINIYLLIQVCPCQTLLVVRWNRWLTKGSFTLPLHWQRRSPTRRRVTPFLRVMPPLPLSRFRTCCSGEFSAVTWLRIRRSSHQMGVGQDGRLLVLTCTLVCLLRDAAKNGVTREWKEWPFLRPYMAFAKPHVWYDCASAMIQCNKV